jgi:hypothetical protein
MTNAFKNGVFENGVFMNGVLARRHDEAIAALAMINNNTWKNSTLAPL